jgi:hypothetical protein
MAQLPITANTCFASLKIKQRALREGFPINLGLRVHRALSWLNRAEMADGDHDAAFIFYWIAFNAAYAEEIDDASALSERAALGDFFRRLTDLDRGNLIYTAIWHRFPQEIRALLHNRYVFQPFWKYQNHLLGFEDWEERFAASRRRVTTALASSDTQTVLMILFDRLYVLRNQLVHGGATWNSQVNRDQVRDGARILALLVPLFVDLMMDNAEVAWGAPYYPVVE